jgi:hypothetical protein
VRSVAATLFTLVLLGATAAAFAYTERLKLQRAPITAPRFDRKFSPTCACSTSTARLTLRFRKRDAVDVGIVDPEGEVVRTLVTGQAVRGDVSFRWDGRDDDGGIVPDGRYRLRLHLDGSGRTFVLPNPIVVDTQPPAAELLAVTRRAISPDGDGRKDALGVAYRSDEAGVAELLVDDRPVTRGHVRAAGKGAVAWDGQRRGQAVPAGMYRLSLQVRDLAGNLSRATEKVNVEVRYVELDRSIYRVPRAGVLRFRVVTDAASYRWRLFRRLAGGGERTVLSGRATRHSVGMRLPVRLTAGRYVLEVAAIGHRDRARVRITRGPGGGTGGD